MPRPSIFICSSTEGLNIAGALQENLCSSFDTEIWNQGAFAIGRNLQQTIIDVCKRFDFGIIVLTPDCLITQSNSSVRIPKDNVLFELGLFIGLLGQDKTFIIHENSPDLRLPDYILGVTCGRFVPPGNGNFTAAMGPVALQIKKAAIPQKSSTYTKSLIEKTLMVVSHALTCGLSSDESKLRAFVFLKEESRLKCTHFWAPYRVCEVPDELSFDINAETQKQIAVVKAAVKKRVCAVSVSVIPENLGGVQGEIDPDLCFIVAAPILSPEGTVLGTVDFDASSKETEAILRRQIVQHVVFELGKILYPMLAGHY